MDNTAANRYKIILTVGILLAFFYYPVVGHFVFSGPGYTQSRVIWSRMLIWLELLILYVYATRLERTKYLLWGEAKYKAGFYFASFGALYLLGIGAGFVSKIPSLFGLHNDNTLMVRMITLVDTSWFLMFFSAFTAGATEELIFRGYLVPRLEVIFRNKYMPVIVSSLMFGLVHYRYGSYQEVLFATLFGVVFAIHYQWYRNIRILIITHAVIDMVSFMLFKAAMHYHLPLK